MKTLFARKLRIERTIGSEIFFSSLSSNIMMNLSGSIGPLVDGAVIGNYLGENAVAAYAVVAPLILIYNLVGGVIAGGSRNIYSNLIGKAEKESANKIFSMACISTFLVSMVMTVVTLLFSGIITKCLGVGGNMIELFEMTRMYLLGYVVGVPFYNTARVIGDYMQIDGDAKRPVYASLAMTIVDIIGDLAVVFLFHGGMFGMGLATAVGNIAFFVVISLHFKRTDRLLGFIFKDLDWKKMSEVIRAGAPSGITRASNFIQGRTVNGILLAFSATSAVAAYGVLRQMCNLFFALYMGVAEVVWLLSSIYYGEEDAKSLKELQGLTVKVGTLLSVSSAVIVFISARLFALLYVGKSSPETLLYAEEGVRYFAFALPFMVLTYSFQNYLMGIGRVRQANIFGFLQECGMLVSMIFTLTRLLGVRGAWVAYPVSNAIMLFVALRIIRHNKEEDFRDKMLLLPDDFGTKAGAELEFVIESQKEVMGMAAIARLFAEENGADKKRANTLALAVEEMAGNIVKYGFVDGKKHRIYLRMLSKEDELILRIRDDCELFDPKKHYEWFISNSKDGSQGLGLRLIMNMAKDFRYTSTMKTNNLLIKV